MKKMHTQREENPFPYSSTEKRYHTYAHYMKEHFGGRIPKLPIDAGFTCPNIDGKCGTGGCIYCSGQGSGDFVASSRLSVREQIQAQKKLLAHKYDTARCIAYFQAHTNTYAPLSRLREAYEEALACDGIIGLSIATRADCLESDTVAYLGELSHRTHLTVELGLQSSNDQTAKCINRGHDLAAFLEGYRKLRAASPHIRIAVHLILGLPGEGREEMLNSVRCVASLAPDEVKLHLLYVLKSTGMEKLYREERYTPLAEETYVSLVADALELLPPEIVIARLTGDGKSEDLLAPLWSRNKRHVIAAIDRELYKRGSWQGKMQIQNKK